MRPHRLTLKNFTGISSGQGKSEITIDLEHEVPGDAQLVAISGPNGSGKSTIMDNLHPYRLMPSHASGTTPGSFSYYDHIVGGEGAKELIWEHGGVRYLTSIRIRSTAKSKKQEAYLFVVSADGSTSPWTCATSGLSSDGKAENYDQCVEAILGKPEVFFATQFSAQGKTPIAKLTSTEVKRVIAQMLRMDDLASLSAKAAEVFKGLRPHMAAEQDQAMKIRQGLKSLDALESQVANSREQLVQSESELRATASLIADLTVRRASLASALEQQVGVLSQHEAIEEQLRAAEADGNKQRQDLQTRHLQQRRELEQVVMDARNAVGSCRQLLASHQQRKTAAEANLQREGEVVKAERRLEVLRADRAQKLSFIEDHAHELSKIEEIRHSVNQLTADMAKLTSDGEHLAAALKLAQQTAALMEEVPCRGTDFSGKCQLLAQARDASKAVPVQMVKLETARSTYRMTRGNLGVNTNVLQSLTEIDRTVRGVREQLVTVDQEISSCREILALREGVEQAKALLPSIRAEVAAASEALGIAQTREQQLKEREHELSTLQQRETRDLESLISQTRSRLLGLKASLPELISGDAQSELQEQLSKALERQSFFRDQVAEGERKHASAKVELELTQQRLQDAKRHEERARELAQEMSLWTLLCKGLGTDGVIAMSIDDAGPAVSKIANDLLEDCYGGRFVLSIKTQELTATGLQREAFNIEVEDTLRGEVKLLDSMSGGEKVWINECLVRAFALYMAQTCDVRHETLFSDESDGPLDPKRKREYMQMRRAVLERGGYSREYIITQTPELIGMCDAVIDMSPR